MLYCKRHLFESKLKLIPKLVRVLNMNCYHETVVNTMCHLEKFNTIVSQIVHVFQHCRALIVNLQKLFYNSQLASVGDSDRQYTIILFISTILNYFNDRERIRHYLL